VEGDWSRNIVGKGDFKMMLRSKNVRVFLFLTSLVLGISGIFMYQSIVRPSPSGVEKTDFMSAPLSPPHSYFMPIPGKEVSIDDAQPSVPFKISLPKNMGDFVQLKLSLAPQTGSPTVFVIYATSKLPSNASIPDVLDNDGVILTELSISLTEGTLQDAENNFRAAINSTKDYPNGGNLQPVTINGYFGCAGGNVGHCVTWATETTYYQLSANRNYPLQQLIAVAQSISVN
jgi:hypothetical protein